MFATDRVRLVSEFNTLISIMKHYRMMTLDD